MEGEEPSRRGGMKSRRSRLFSGLLGGYSRISQRPRIRLGEESFEEEKSEEAEETTSLADFPEALEAPNIAYFNKPLVSHSEPNFLKMMEDMTLFMR
ncbi:hypothetical protein O181_005332 [Austropuccinia psidii MF-1]|uniref:Uncharacterized protein n=1 Tax=Austropuccinia psidii MF-1 TaxID=1389203 RepID=A0A9Q3BIJ6_9BASI|nr:hypothetical protein [Austropuccinia psidii MF-1]